MNILDDDEYNDYSDFLESIKEKALNIQKVNDLSEKNKRYDEIINSLIEFSNEIALSGDYFEAAELLYSAAEILEDINFLHVNELYMHKIKLYEKQIKSFKLQAKIHEIAELHLRIADLYGGKLQNDDLEKQHIEKSINNIIPGNKCSAVP